MKYLVLGSAIAVVATLAYANSAETAVTKHVHPIEIQSKIFISFFEKDATIEQSVLRMESYLNPYSMIIVDKELNQYASFAANSIVVKWDTGFVIQKSDDTTFLCENPNFEVDECIKIYRYSKHGLSKSPII